VLNPDGSPTPVERVLIRPPESRIGPLTDDERQAVLERSPLKGRYDETIDRESAHEKLQQRAEEAERIAAAEKAEQVETRSTTRRTSSGSRRQSASEAMVKSAARAVGSQIGRSIVRGILDTLLGGRK